MPQPKTKRARRLLILLAVVLVALAGVASWKWYLYRHPLEDPRYSFQYYEPTYLPEGFSLPVKTLFVNPRAHHAITIASFRTEDNVYSIDEMRGGGGPTASDRLNNYDPTSIGYTCKQTRSPEGQDYRLCHSVDYDRIGRFEVTFTINRYRDTTITNQTYIQAAFPTTKTQVMSEQEISKFVDSFVAAKPTGFTVEYNTGP